jgi:antitoxin component YwqK of YwqJK toxin-antitoxin module
MRYLVILLSLIFLALNGYSQHLCRKINKLDAKGNRHGRWITWQDSARRLPSSKCWFKHGLEYRTTRYYHANGRVRLLLHYKGDSMIRVKYLDTLGHVTQKGKAKRLYTPTEIRYCWDGEWKFYDENHKLYRVALYRKGEEVTDGIPAIN